MTLLSQMQANRPASGTEVGQGRSNLSGSPVTFVDGMRKVAHSVAVITACHDGKRRGVTATAVCSISADPPMLAVCLNKSGSAYDTISTSDHFAVNILSSDQQSIADAFAGRLPQDLRFDDASWTIGANGAPILEDALASFECERQRDMDASTHTLFIGLVENVNGSGHSDPLLYHDRQYKNFN
jgi:flavin reductase (DIM6/NTAB) family NADH-FMN oxidoreductase RutF